MAMGNRWVDEEQKPTRHREKKFVLKAFTGHFRSARHHERRDATRRRGKCIPERDDEQIVEYSVLSRVVSA